MNDKDTIEKVYTAVAEQAGITCIGVRLLEETSEYEIRFRQHGAYARLKTDRSELEHESPARMLHIAQRQVGEIQKLLLEEIANRPPETL
jgi:hypothetical protein